MMDNKPAETAFFEGDEVVLAKGSYQGTLGVFIKLRQDARWADIRERNGGTRCHPVEWLTHSTGVAAWAPKERLQ